MTDQVNSDANGLNALAENPHSETIATYYDEWADTYDADLAKWRYEAPLVAATMLSRQASLNGIVFDAGCGTGLTGRALRSVGFKHIDGADISSNSLRIAAKTKAYSNLWWIDLQKCPLKIPDDTYDALICVGVLSYVPESEAILKEFCRIVRPGGCVVFTQREDLFVQRECTQIIAGLETNRTWERITLSDPRPYLPANDAFGDRIRVIYGVFRVL